MTGIIHHHGIIIHDLIYIDSRKQREEFAQGNTANIPISGPKQYFTLLRFRFKG